MSARSEVGRKSALTPPNVLARAAIVIDASSGKVLFEKNPDLRLPPASTTKIMTGLLFARKVAPQISVPTSPLAASIPGSRLGMSPGTKYSQKDIMHAMLLLSANDACVAAAEEASGSVPKFVDEMNEEAKKDGAPNTHFTNPHGLQNPNHYSTARDLGNIARVAMNNSQFRKIVKTRRYKIPRSGNHPSRLLQNTDDILWSFPGAEGIKTGWTRAAGLCFVGSAVRGHTRIITVLLNSPNWQQETAEAMNYGFEVESEIPTSASHPLKSGLSKKAVTNSITPKSISAIHGRKKIQLPDQDISDADLSRYSDMGAQSPGGAKSDSMTPVAHGRGGAYGSISGGGRTSAQEESTPNTPKAAHSQNTSASVKVSSKIPAQNYKIDCDNTMQNQHKNDAPKKGHISWWWLLLLAIALFLFLFRRKKNQLVQDSNAMNPSNSNFERSAVGNTFAVSSLSAQLSNENIVCDQATSDDIPAVPIEVNDVTPLINDSPTEEIASAQLPYSVPQITRLTGRKWWETVIENPNHLLNPMTLRESKAFIDAEPAAVRTMVGLLYPPNPKVQLAAAEMVASSSPSLAEGTLQSIVDSAPPGSEISEAAILQLGRIGGDRFEKQALETLLREGSLAAAVTLFNQNMLSSSTTKECERIVNLPRTESNPSEAAMKSDMLKAYCSCILLKHGNEVSEKVAECLHFLPEKNKEEIVNEFISGIDSLWAVEMLVNSTLKLNSARGIQNLFQCRPEFVQKVIDDRREFAYNTEKLRLDTLDWLILGVGDEKNIRKLKDAGDPLAADAVRLYDIHHPNISELSSEAVCSALQIVSLRLSYSEHSQMEINNAFSIAASKVSDLDSIKSESLRQLAAAYTNSDVRKAVQFAMLNENGKHMLLEQLSQAEESSHVVDEIDFWTGKSDAQTRLMLVSALARFDSPEAKSALAARSQDPDPVVKNTVLRALRPRSHGDEPVHSQVSSVDLKNNKISKRAA